MRDETASILGQLPAFDIERSHDAPKFCDTLSFSAGRDKSFSPAATKHHFIIGAQKNTVFGPSYQHSKFARGKSGIQKPRTSDADQVRKGRVAAPAGWFINAWKRDAPADAAAPDMVLVF